MYYNYTIKNTYEISRIFLNQVTYKLRATYGWKVLNFGIHYYLERTVTITTFVDPMQIVISYSALIYQCLQGFKPKSPERHSLMEKSQGCVLNKPLSCQKDGFDTYSYLKLPDTTYSWVNGSMSLNKCWAKCLNN